MQGAIHYSDFHDQVVALHNTLESVIISRIGGGICIQASFINGGVQFVCKITGVISAQGGEVVDYSFFGVVGIRRAVDHAQEDVLIFAVKGICVVGFAILIGGGFQIQQPVGIVGGIFVAVFYFDVGGFSVGRYTDECGAANGQGHDERQYYAQSALGDFLKVRHFLSSFLV